MPHCFGKGSALLARRVTRIKSLIYARKKECAKGAGLSNSAQMYADRRKCAKSLERVPKNEKENQNMRKCAKT